MVAIGAVVVAWLLWRSGLFFRCSVDPTDGPGPCVLPAVATGAAAEAGLTMGAGSGSVADEIERMVTVEASYLEIYNERVRDLLDVSATRGGVPGSHSGLHPHGVKVREHPTVRVNVLV